MPVVYPGGTATDRERLFAVYSLIEQMRLEHNRVAEIARSHPDIYIKTGKFKTYQKQFEVLFEQLLAAQNHLKENILLATYTTKEWQTISKLPPAEQIPIYVSLYGDRNAQKINPTIATSSELDELKTLDLDNLPGTLGSDPTEDLTTYTEVDPSSKITVTAPKSAWASLARNEDAYLYKDKGAAHFAANFEHLLDVNVSVCVNDAFIAYWALTNLINDLKGIIDASGDGLFAATYGSTPSYYCLYLYELVAGTLYADYTAVFAVDTTRYLKFKRDEAVGSYGTLYCYVYSDADRTTLWDTLTLTLHEKEDFRYIYVTQTYNDAQATKTQTGFSQNLDLQEGGTTHQASATLAGAGSLSAAATVTNIHKLIGQDDQTIYASVGANYHWTDKFTAVASGQMDRFRIKCSGSGNVKIAVYADSAGSPGALLTAVKTGQAVVAGWNTITFPATSITQGTAYWLSFITDAAVVGYWNQAGNTRKYKSIAYAGFSFPDPAGSFDDQFTDVPDLTAGWQLSLYASATLSGAGTLAAAGKVTRRGKATLSGTGSLAGIGKATHTGKATLSGTGTLAGAGKVTRTGKATLSGTGTLAAAGQRITYAKATLSGTGALVAAGTYLHKASATLSGTGDLAAAGTLITAALSGSATLSGAGFLTVTAVVITTAKATMSGTGDLVAAAHLITLAAATLSGTGSLSSQAVITTAASATLSGEGTLTARAIYIVIARATMAGVGSLSAIGTISGLTATLLAAQKAPIHIPYVEAKVYDYEQGIKRLTWTRLYDGSETDNHHGIAFDGEGSMHRIRAATGNKLYYQKVANPGPSSDYSSWTEIATDCAGPCAIAAYGAKVYIFYRTTTNVLWKYYSHNYGSSWTNAQLIATADVLSMAACWKGTTSTVVCFSATAIKISAAVLDTSDQATTEYYYNHALDATYGIGATYQDGEFPIVLAGKDTDVGTSIVSYALYATKLSDLYIFGALRVLLTADEDVATAFRYPDCHLPAPVGEGLVPSYETIQLTVVEDYSGITPYTSPLTCHLVKDTAWSSATITEPKFFLPITSAYGLRITSNSDHWWFSTPSGVWRAPRPAADPLDLTPYIQQLRQVIAHQKPGYLTITLDNSRGYFASPGEGDLASLRFRAEIALKLGYKTTAGAETIENLTYWVDSWEYSSSPNLSLFTLHCLDLWGLASQWAARYSLRWNYTTFQPCRVWEILYQLLGRLGIRLWNNGGVTQSDPMNDYYPMFLSRGGTMADTQLRRLLSFATDGLVPRQGICYVKDLLPAEASSYSYGEGAAGHPIYAGAYGDKLTISHAQVSGDTEDEPPVHVREAAFDWNLLSLGIDNLRMQYDANLEETDQAARRADALLRDSSLRAERGNLVIPTNVGQALYDVITVTDRRCGVDQEKYRVLAIQTDYDRHNSQYEQRLTLGAP